MLNAINNKKVKKLDDHSPLALYKLYKALAFVENSNENVSSSITHLEEAIKAAGDLANREPLRFMISETYLNAAHACIYLLRHQEALEYAELSVNSTAIILMAINHVQLSGPEMFTLSQLEEMRMSQIDCQVHSFMVKAQALEKLAHFN